MYYLHIYQKLQVNQIPGAHPVDAQQAVTRLDPQLIANGVRLDAIHHRRSGKPDLSICLGQDHPGRRLIPHRPLLHTCLQSETQLDQATLRAAQRITPRPKKTR